MPGQVQAKKSSRKVNFVNFVVLGRNLNPVAKLLVPVVVPARQATWAGRPESTLYYQSGTKNWASGEPNPFPILIPKICSFVSLFNNVNTSQIDILK